MKVAVIGAGFTGLSAAWDLTQAGHQVTIFEQSEQPGGLAGGFKQEGWHWFLEYFYHHIFAKDEDALGWISELGLDHLVFFKSTKTATLFEGDISALDSPLALLTYSKLGWLAKLRTAATLTFLKLLPSGAFLEKWTAKNFLQATMGQQAWKVLWKPLFVKKFGKFSDQVNAAWFWARIKARTRRLGYFKGGFQGLARAVVMKLGAVGVEFEFNQLVKKVVSNEAKGGLTLVTTDADYHFDQVLFTGVGQELISLAPDLPKKFTTQIKDLPLLAAQALVLELDKPFFQDKTYWLNINQLDWPMLAVVEHTNFISSDHYEQSHLVYVGDYLTVDDSVYKLDKQKLFELYQPHLDKLSPDFTDHVRGMHLFRAENSQPVPCPNHSRVLPKIKTPLSSLYWAGMQQIYPYDRGVNYAVKIGRQAAQTILCSS